MGAPIRPNTFADGEFIDALRVNEDLDELYAWAGQEPMMRDGSTNFSALPSGPGGGAIPGDDAQLANKLYVDQNKFAWLGSGGPGSSPLLIRSGTKVGAAGTASTTVNYGATFPNGVLSVQVTPLESTELIQCSVQVGWTTSSFVCRHVLRTGDAVPAGVTPQFTWVAFGY